MTDYARLDAKITSNNGKITHYNVLETLVKISEDDRFKTEDEVKDCFYLIVDEDERNSWDYSRIDLEYTCGEDTICTTIYGGK